MHPPFRAIPDVHQFRFAGYAALRDIGIQRASRRYQFRASWIVRCSGLHLLAYAVDHQLIYLIESRLKRLPLRVQIIVRTLGLAQTEFLPEN